MRHNIKHLIQSHSEFHSSCLTMKVVGVFLMCIVYQACGLALPDSQLISSGSDENGNGVATTTDSQIKAKELLTEALEYLSQDLKDTKSKVETKLKSLEKVKLHLKHVNPLDLFVNISLNTIDSENEVEEVDVSHSQRKKKYSVFKELVNWYSANRLCKAKGFELASVESEAEQEELMAALQSSGAYVGTWVGGHRVEDDGEFVWSSSGKPLSYTNWVPGDSSESPYNCVHISDYSKWIHYECDHVVYFYACEYSE